MDKLKIKAYAKINLSLDVIRKRDDGYHDLKMIMQTIDLYDEIRLKIVDDGINVETNLVEIPKGKDNIAYKAANLIKEKYNLKKGIDIFIEKNIPSEAGMAGGSTDAAAVIKGMNKLFDLKITEENMISLAKCIGADVPFCIMGGTALSEGIGEKLTKLKPLLNVELVIVKPDFSVSTGWAYNNLDLNDKSNRPDTEKLLDAVENKDILFIAKNMKNVFENLIAKEYKIVDEIKSTFEEYGAIGSMMTGSGSAIFAIFDNEDIAKKAAVLLKEKNIGYVFRAKTN
jgi:4-diphosphocytidyl-2-C-methyl-D-erythritol kinase